MSHEARSTSNAYSAYPGSYACPVCGQPGLLRVRRRLIDRILSVFLSQRRFRCTQPGCAWEGNLRKKAPRERVTQRINHVR